MFFSGTTCAPAFDVSGDERGSLELRHDDLHDRDSEMLLGEIDDNRTIDADPAQRLKHHLEITLEAIGFLIPRRRGKRPRRRRFKNDVTIVLFFPDAL